MIYNEDLTNDLVQLFGEQVLSWSKEKIRNKLEDLTDEKRDSILNSNEVSKDQLKTYQYIKDIDDKFTLEYILDLDKKN